MTEGWTEADGRRMREQIGEDPAAILDRPLRTSSGWRHSPVGYDKTSDPIGLIRDRIRGIDHLQVVAGYLTVEHRLERGPRDRVVSMLEDRREHLETAGERDLPGWSRAERRERAEQQFERVKDQKLGRRDHSDVHVSSGIPWPTGKDALDDTDEETDDVEQADEQATQDAQEAAEQASGMLEDPEDHPLVAGFLQASSETELATDGGQRDT